MRRVSPSRCNSLIRVLANDGRLTGFPTSLLVNLLFDKNAPADQGGLPQRTRPSPLGSRTGRATRRLQGPMESVIAIDQLRNVDHRSSSNPIPTHPGVWDS